jgi:HEAT repeat protein
MVISSTPGPAGRDGPPLAQVLRDAGVGEVPEIAFLFGFDSEGRGAGDVDWMMIRSADAPADLSGLPLYWLGTPSQEESLAQLTWLTTRTPLAEVQAELVAALTLHAPGSETHEAIAAAIAAAPDEEVRAEVADWLPNQGTPADVALLERLAMVDPSPEVRQEAASGLAEFTDPAAVAALLRLGRRASDPRVRSEAVQRLDESRSDEVVAVLTSMAFEDPVAAVRLDAIDVLAGMDTSPARAALRQVAADHPDGLVRQAAFQALPTDD